MADDEDLEDGEARRTIAIASYWVRSPREAEEVKFLARLAGDKRFTHLVFRVVDAEIERLRVEFAAPLAEWRAAQDRIAQLTRG
jgi:hypothetical protein